MSAVGQTARGIRLSATAIVALLAGYLLLTALPLWFGVFGIGPYQGSYFFAEAIVRTVFAALLVGGLFAAAWVWDTAVGG